MKHALSWLTVIAILCPSLACATGETISPNMQLVVPAVGITSGPQWAADLDISLGIIDSHDHSPGKGVAVTPAGLDINSDLSCQGNSVTNTKSVMFSAQASPVANGSIYESGVDLYYVDGNGNNVRLTQSGSVVGTPGSISGLTSPASASYSPGSSTFVWQSAINTSANLDAACLLQRDLTASSNAITICPPAALAANYSLTWPAALPAAQKFLTVDNSGNIADLWAADNSTLEVSGNSLQVKAAGIGTTQLASASVTPAKMAAATTTTSSVATGFTTTSASYPGAAVTGVSATISATGLRPVLIRVDGIHSVSVFDLGGSFSISGGATATYFVTLLKGGSTNVGTVTTAGVTPASAVSFIDYPSAGSVTYQLYVQTGGSGGTITINNIYLNVIQM